MVCEYPTGERGRARGGRLGPRSARSAGLTLLALLLSACASTPTAGGPVAPAPRAGFDFHRDTFAFPNIVGAQHPDRAEPFTNYCLIMTRAASQFFRFARFAPDQPPLSDAEYTRRIRDLIGISPWEAPRPAEQRVVVPGYPDLRSLSGAREAAVKAAFEWPIPGMTHLRVWRMAWPLGRGHQHRLAGELSAELDRGWPVPVMITNHPEMDLLSHAVLVYGYRRATRVVEFLAYDPNDAGTPLTLQFDPESRAFWVEPLPYGPPGRVRAFRIYTSPLF
jgi:hypothetical protein